MDTAKPAPPTESPEDLRVVHRPDGYWLQSDEGDFGPFAHAAEALEVLESLEVPAGEGEAQGGEESEPENLEEAEAEIGVSSWIDPESGELAEDSVPRLEEH